MSSSFEQEAKRMAALNKYKHKHMDSDSDKSLVAALLIFLGALVLIPALWLYGVFAYGFVAVKLWAWFIVPVFHPEITFGILQAAGLIIFVRFFTSDHRMPPENPDETTVQKVTKVLVPILAPWVTLLFAWVLKAMM
jgi:hypothetical protein